MADRPRRGWRPTRGMILSGLAGATVATLIAVSPQLTQERDRRDLASGMQAQFRQQGLPYSVAAAGEDHRILRIEAPSMTGPFAEYLARGPAKAEYFAGLGFAAITFANGRGGSWTYDLAQRKFR